MRATKIKKIKDLLENAIKKAKFGLEKEGTDTTTEEFQERIESLKSAILKKAGVTKEEYELAERFFDTELDLLRTKIRVGKLETKKTKWGEVEEKPEIKPFDQSQIKDLEFSQLKHKDEDHKTIVGNILDLKEEDRALAEKIQQTKEELKTIATPRIRHGELLAIGKDDHHPEEHNLESHVESDWKDKFKRLIGGQRVDDLHTHAFPLDKPWVGEPWGITKGDTDVWYLHLAGTNSPSANINWGGFKITNLADPTADQDASTKAYVDAQISGENWWDRAGTVLSPHNAGDSVTGVNITSGVDPGHTHSIYLTDAPSDGTMYGRRDGAWERMTLMPPVEEYWDITEGLPPLPEEGDRYISDGEDEELGWYDGYIYEWDGEEWVESVPEIGWMVWLLLEMVFWVFMSDGWREVGWDSYWSLWDAQTGIEGDKSGSFDLATTGTISGINVTSGADPGHTHTAYLGLHAKADDSDLLDGHDTSYFQIAGSYQPLDADLSAIAALGFTSTSFLKKTAADTWALDTNTYLTSLSGAWLNDTAQTGLTGDKTGTFNLTTTGILDVGTFITPYDQVITVAKSGADYTKIQDAIDAILDATITKRYCIKVQSGVYTEQITMKDYVDIQGSGRTNCIINSTSGTALTFPATKATVMDAGITSTYGILGADSTCIISGCADASLLRCSVEVSKSGGNKLMKGIKITGGSFRATDSRVNYVITGAAAAALEQSAICQTGAATIVLLHNCEITMTGNDAVSDLVGFETLAGSAGSFLVQNCIFDAANTGTASFATGVYLHGTATGATIASNRITLSAPANTWGYYIISDAGGAVVNSRHNEIITSGAGTNYTAYVDSGDTLNSAFDKITAAGGQDMSGAGTVNLVSSLTSGALIISSLTASKPVFTSSTKQLTSTGIGTSSQFIKGDGSLDSSTYLTSVTAHNLLSATHGDSTTGSAVLGDLIYADANPKWTKLAGNITTTKKYLSQTGTGAISAVPAWAQIAITDLASFTSANLAGVISDETGSDKLVFNTSPTLVTPVLGVATATSINKIAFTTPANGSTITIVDGKTLTVNDSTTLGTNSVLFAGAELLTLAATKNVIFADYFATVGAFPLILTTTAATNVTLPAGGTLATLARTETFTNKRITQRVTTVADSATPTPDADASDMFTVTALAQAATFGAPTGTPTSGQKLIIRILDNGTARALAWNAIYRAGTDVALPTTTVLSKTLYCGFIYNVAATKWDLVATTNNI
jgi:hypothetical protein